MPRRASYHWDKGKQAYRTDAGGRTTYFRGIARDDRMGIARAFTEHLERLAAEARPPEMNVFTLALLYLKADRGIRPITKQTHKDRLMRFCGFDPGDGAGPLGTRPARSIEAKHLRAAIAHWGRPGQSAHSAAGNARSVLAAFNWAASEEGGRLIPTNPLVGVKTPKTGHSPDRYADRREVAAFLRFAWRRAGATPGVRRNFGRIVAQMIRVAIHTGARPATLASAWWSDFDEARGTITLPPDRHKTGSKTNKPLVLYLPPGPVRSLRRLRDRPGRHPVAIFTHERGPGSAAKGGQREAGDPWGRFITLPGGRPSFDPRTRSLSETINRFRKEAIALGKELADAGRPTRGLELIRDDGANRFVMYRLRHTKASDDLMRGGNPAAVAALLGTSVKMLETTYGHFQDDHLARVAAGLAASGRRKK